MRIAIIPKAGLLEPATHFSCDNHRVVAHNIVSTVAFWAASGRKLAERDATLTEAQYLAWCDLTADDPDDPYFLAAHMDTLGIEAAPVPPPPPAEPSPPETEEERITREAAEREQAIADITAQIDALNAQLAALQE